MDKISVGFKKCNVLKLIILLLVLTTISMSSLCKHKPDDNYQPVNVSNNNGQSQNPSIAVDSRNTVHLVWNDDTPGNEEIFYSNKPAGDSWSTPINISNNSQASRYPCIKIDKNDNIHIVWQDYSPNGNWRIFYLYKPFQGVWAIVETISTSFGDVTPKIDVDSHGNVYMVWYAGGYTGWIFFSIRESNNFWTQPKKISPQIYIEYPQIALDIIGNVHVTWSYWDGYNRTDIMYMIRDTIGNWSDTLAILPTNDISFTPVLTSDKEGNLHLTWDDSTLIYLYRSIQGDWSTPEFLTLAGSGNPGGIVVDDNGTIYICYGSTKMIKKIAHNSWTEPILVHKTGNNNPSLVVDRRGVKHIAWHCTPNDNIDKTDIYYLEINNY